jgi:phage recombination protein Bet
MSEEKNLEIVTDDIVKSFIDSFLPGKLLKHETAQFLEIAKAYNLNPFKREIHCVAYGQGEGRKLSIITGYEVYLKRAERLKALDGWTVTTAGSVASGDLRAIITIYRKDWTHPFTHEVYFSEYVQNNSIWKSKPITMIRKVVTAQGFRLAFPDELGGMPYTADELPDNMTRDVTPAPATAGVKMTASTAALLTAAPEPKVVTPDEPNPLEDQPAPSGEVSIKDKIIELIKDITLMKNQSMEDQDLCLGIRTGRVKLTTKQYNALYNRLTGATNG